MGWAHIFCLRAHTTQEVIPLQAGIQTSATPKINIDWPVKGVQFALGGTGYGLIELLWRGNTHPSMWLAGGVCFCGFSCIGHRLQAAPLLYRQAAGALWVTAVEFVFGLVCNLWLKLNVWDYSHLPFHILGQICLLFTVFWGILAGPGIFLACRTELVLRQPIFKTRY